MSVEVFCCHFNSKNARLLSILFGFKQQQKPLVFIYLAFVFLSLHWQIQWKEQLSAMFNIYVHNSVQVILASEDSRSYLKIQSIYVLRKYILLIIERMFNLEIDDLAEKPYITQKNCFYEFVANVLRENIGTLSFDLHQCGMDRTLS